MSKDDAGRIKELDGVRGIAAGCVLVAHFFPRDTLAWKSLQFGRFGVVAFFVLSGFLIVNILLRSRVRIEHGLPASEAWKEFYLRRSLRILPLYMVVLAAFVAADYRPVVDRIWWHLTYTSNLGYSLFGVDFANLSHFWSLCVEEQFYLVVPCFVLMIPVKRSFTILGVAFAICSAFKIGMAVLSSDVQLVARLPITNTEGIAFGALIAYAYYDGRAERALSLLLKWGSWPAFVGTIALSIGRLQMGDQVYTTWWYMGLTDFAFAGVATAVVGRAVSGRLAMPLARVLSAPPLVYLGTISYGTYVFHFAMIPFFSSMLGPLGIADGGYADFVARSFISVSMAAASWRFFERPVLGLKSKIWPETAAAKPIRM